MANPGHDALFYGPGIRSDAEHFEVVIGFEDEAVAGAELVADIARQETEIGGDGHAHSFGEKAEADGIGGVMWEW